MKKVTLVSLTLRNFKKFREKTVNFNEKETFLTAMNEEGKTTIFDAYRFLIDGKNSKNKVDLELKHNQASKDEAYSVEGVFLFNGETIVLKRQIFEKWVRKRGTADEVFNGNETEFFIDSVPAKKKEYDSKVSEMFNSDFFDLFSNVFLFHDEKYFPTAKRRAFLLDIVKDEIDEKGLLEKYGIDPAKKETLKKELKAKKSEIEQELSETKPKIEEVSGLIKTDLSYSDCTALEEEIKAVEVNKNNVLKTIQDSEKEIGELQKKKSNLSLDISRLEFKISNEREDFDSGIKRELEKLEKELKENEADILELEKKISEIEAECKQKESELSVLKNDIQALKTEAESFDFEGMEIDQCNCSYCGQTLPEEKLHEAKQSAIKNKQDDFKRNFNAKKQAYEYKKTEILNLVQNKKSNLIAEHAGKIQERKLLNGKIEEVKSKSFVADNSLKTELETLKKQHDSIEIHEINIPDLSEYDDRLKALRDSLTEKQISNHSFNENNNLISRLDNLKKMQASQNEALGAIERELINIELFEFELVSEIQNKVNLLFDGIEIKMFRENIGEGYTDVCYAVNQEGVSFYGTNRASQYHIGTKIISVLSRRLGFSFPLFIDDSEGVLNPIETDLQVIYLQAKNQKPNF